MTNQYPRPCENCKKEIEAGKAVKQDFAHNQIPYCSLYFCKKYHRKFKSFLKNDAAYRKAEMFAKLHYHAYKFN